MSSYPDHESNINKLREMNLDIDSIDLGDDPYDTWNYDELTSLVTELIDVIKELKTTNQERV